MTAYLTPAAIAEALGCNQTKILSWLKSGELRGVNIAQQANGRPRWRISQEAFDSFLAARSASPPIPAVRRRRRADPSVIEFF